MRRPFKDKKGGADFNDDIGGWDVSNVKNMNWMFNGATSFNQPLEKWDVSKVEDMEGTFHGTRAFNQLLDKWDVSSFATSTRMFV